jgi:hypothetical protein
MTTLLFLIVFLQILRTFYDSASRRIPGRGLMQRHCSLTLGYETLDELCSHHFGIVAPSNI